MPVVTDKDKGWKDIARELRAMNKKKVVVGVLGDGPKHPSGTNMADIATWNEFGTTTTPMRSFLRSTFDERLKQYESFLKRNMGRLGPNLSAEQLMGLFGLKVTNDVKRKIVSIKAPPNTPATIANKKSSNPLIDTGRMRQSIDFEVK